MAINWSKLNIVEIINIIIKAETPIKKQKNNNR
jgi:hypothetical protein